VVAEKTQFFRDDERGAIAQGNKAHSKWLRFPARSELTIQRIMHNDSRDSLTACHGAAFADKGPLIVLMSLIEIFYTWPGR
jgi:hypothetical protein